MLTTDVPPLRRGIACVLLRSTVLAGLLLSVTYALGMAIVYTALGVCGHCARAIIFGLIGYGLIKAALEYDSHKAVGLDGVLRKLAHASYGPLLLGIVAAGLVMFACYSIADARYRRV